MRLGGPSLEPEIASASLGMLMKSFDGASIGTKVEKFCEAVGNSHTHHIVHFQGRSELQKWLCLGYVNFTEVFIRLWRSDG